MAGGKRTGRRLMLTQERIARIAELVAAGNNLETAAAASGVSKSAFFAWMARGRAEQERVAGTPRVTRPRASEAVFVELVEAVEKARAEADARLVLLISRAAQEPRTWQAAAWLLERRDPGRWGRTSRENAQNASAGVRGEVQEAVSRMVDGQPGLPVESVGEPGGQG